MKKIIIITIILLSNIQIYSQTKQLNQSNQNKAKEICKEAIKLIDEKKTEEAVSLLRKAQKLDNKSIIYPYEIAVAYYDKERYGDAIKVLDSLRNHKEVSDQVYQLLGNCFDYLAKRDDARDIYKEGLTKFPNSGRLYLELGILEIEEERIVEGKKYWVQGTRVQPNFDNLHYWLAKQYNKDTMDVFALVSGECFLNLTNNDAKFNEISKMMFDIFNTSIIKKDSTYIFSFKKNQKETTYFELAYEMLLNKAIGDVDLSDGLNIQEICQIRTNFIHIWYKEQADKRYPNLLYDFQNKMVKENVFEPYNFWIFSGAAFEEFKNWGNNNKELISQYIKWRGINPFNLNDIKK